MPLRVHKQRSQGIGLLLGLLQAGAAQGGTHPGHELHHTEGLGHIVVRPLVQAQYLVILRALGGEHDDLDLPGGGHGPHPAEDLQAVLLGQHNVQQDQLRNLFLHGLPEQGGTLKTLCFHSLALQRIDHQLSDAGVVLQNIDHGQNLQ